MRNDDAIAPIVAVMLILVVIVTLLSVYNATYLPGLKQSAEIQHLHDVEEGILKFGSALEEAASLKRNISFSQQIPLGGGDILLNSLKSGGSLQVRQEDEPYLTIFIEGESHPLYLINLSYFTVSNFWVDQAYSWQYGYVNVSRGSGSQLVDSTPLQFATMDDVCEELEDSSFGNTLIEIDPSEDGSYITIEAVNFSPCDEWFTSGNGMGQIRLDSRKDTVRIPGVNVSFAISTSTELAANLRNQSEINREYTGVNVTLILTDITISVR